jgi:hypothetical protein
LTYGFDNWTLDECLAVNTSIFIGGRVGGLAPP